MVSVTTSSGSTGGTATGGTSVGGTSASGTSAGASGSLAASEADRQGRLFLEGGEIAAPSEQLLRCVGHLEFAAAGAAEDDVFAGLYAELLAQLSVGIEVPAHQTGQGLDLLFDRRRLLHLEAFRGRLQVVRREGRELQLRQQRAAKARRIRVPERARMGGGGGDSGCSAEASAEASEETSATGGDSALGDGGRCGSEPQARPKPSRSGCGPSRPARAGPAPRRCCGRPTAVWRSHRSASSNRCCRSLMSASALSAITFSPSRREHVGERGFGGRQVAEIQMAAAQHDAGRDVVGMQLEPGPQQLQRARHVAVLAVDLGQGRECESLGVLGVTALEFLDLAKCHPGPGFSGSGSLGGTTVMSLRGSPPRVAIHARPVNC